MVCIYGSVFKCMMALVKSKNAKVKRRFYSFSIETEPVFSFAFLLFTLGKSVSYI